MGVLHNGITGWKTLKVSFPHLGISYNYIIILLNLISELLHLQCSVWRQLQTPCYTICSKILSSIASLIPFKCTGVWFIPIYIKKNQQLNTYQEPFWVHNMFGYIFFIQTLDRSLSFVYQNDFEVRVSWIQLLEVVCTQSPLRLVGFSNFENQHSHVLFSTKSKTSVCLCRVRLSDKTAT